MANLNFSENNSKHNSAITCICLIERWETLKRVNVLNTTFPYDPEDFACTPMLWFFIAVSDSNVYIFIRLMFW